MVTPGPLRAADLPPYYNAVHILEHNLALRAGKEALLTPSRTLTFGEVSAEVNRVGNALVRLGVRFGETVGLLCLDSAEWVTSFFGIMKMGGVAVGLNTLLKPREQAYTLTDARVRVLILHRDLLPTLEPIRDELRFLEHVIVVGGKGRPGDRSFSEWIAPETDQLQTASTHREDFCSLNYSSGTTGEPKGILHAHKDYPITAQLVGVNGLGLGEADRTFGAPKLFFTFGTGGNLIFPWFVGASVVLYPGPPRVATNVLEVIDRFKPTIHYNAPTDARRGRLQQQVRPSLSAPLRVGRGGSARSDLSCLEGADGSGDRGRPRLYRELSHVHHGTTGSNPSRCYR
jgi:acyl-coenzyme A synthetase/AMP-(fatty) acid ligase